MLSPNQPFMQAFRIIFAILCVQKWSRALLVNSCININLTFRRHASEICRMALDLQAASGMVVRPDIRPKTIMMKCGIHTGSIVAGMWWDLKNIHFTIHMYSQRSILSLKAWKFFSMCIVINFKAVTIVTILDIHNNCKILLCVMCIHNSYPACNHIEEQVQRFTEIM